MLAAITALKDWSDFYVILGSAAGALTGLMFVVVALSRDRGMSASLDVQEAYSTPIVVHLATVLVIAALITTPRHSELSLALCLGGGGTAGLVYGGWIFVLTRKQAAYREFLSDWVWRHILPGLGYLGVFVAGPLVYADAEVALYLVAASALLLLVAGIHNAWDSAVWISTDHSDLDP